MNRLRALQQQGQSVWIDYIRRNMILSGELQRLVDQDGLRGVTSNPSIFHKAITASTDYANQLAAMRNQSIGADEMYERLAVRDIQDAADVMWPVYEATARHDGYVSFEVSPSLAHDAERTVAEARRLHNLIARENVMIKVPATEAGIRALRQLISDGLCINVTLLFAREMYRKVAEAYIAGIEDLLKRGGDPSRVASVASFFVSRIDTAVDAEINAKLKSAAGDQQQLQSLLGGAAIANAKLAYQDFKRIVASDRWKKLAGAGAQPQRLLWASTSTKNPKYRDVIYVEELIGPQTVNTIPPSTFDGFRDHGRVEPTLDEGIDEAREVLTSLERAGIQLDQITSRLLDEGLKLFGDAFDDLMKALGAAPQAATAAAPAVNRFEYRLPRAIDAAVHDAVNEWRAHGNMKRLWAGDATLWTGSDEANWLGWLRVTEGQLPHLQPLLDVASDITKEGFRHAVLLGMGGSSLTPEVLKLTLGAQHGYPELHVLDSTDPQQIKDVESRIDLQRTVFIVSSKSGSTLEPNILFQYFFQRVSDTVGAERAGSHFIAVTDPGSKVEQTARARGFRHVFPGVPTIGGRYSALSNFGLVPAAVMGLDVARLLKSADQMVQACAPTVPVGQNPGAVLGIVLGTLANAGVNKLTVVASPPLASFGAWLEQLLAESTGKDGKAIIPVDGEQPGAPEVYGKDRVFAYVQLENAADAAQEARIRALEDAGFPVVRITVSDPYQIAQEFFRWEIATAVAGAIMRLNPFNQPDVEASKIVTRELASEYERTGQLPSQAPLVSEDGVQIFGDIGSGARSLAAALRAHLNSLRDGDYFAVLAYAPKNHENEQAVQALRHAVRDAKRVATCVGFGPRFLHSTGQAYKGGPNSGVFLQITGDHAEDFDVPGQKYTFGVIEAAQALGDLNVLQSRGRRVLRAHLAADTVAGLRTLHAALTEALRQMRQAA